MPRAWSVLSADSSGQYAVPPHTVFALTISAKSPQAPLLVSGFQQMLADKQVTGTAFNPGQPAPADWPPLAMDPTHDATDCYRFLGRVSDAGPVRISSGLYGADLQFPVRVFTSPVFAGFS